MTSLIFKNVFKRKIFFKSFLIIQFFLSNLIILPLKSFNPRDLNIRNEINATVNKESNKFIDIPYQILISEVKWEPIKNTKEENVINWYKYVPKEAIDFSKEKINNRPFAFKKYTQLNSLNRSIVFNNEIVGPDVSWLVPPGLQWNKKHKLDLSIRGHSRRDLQKRDHFFGWNGGDAVGQFYYQPFINEKYSYGINFGARSIYSGNELGGETPIGEGISMGFRIDRKLSNRSGFSFGAEQLLHFDGLTDTGRDIYLTFTNGWWKDNIEGSFPLKIATFGFGTGKLAEGNIKGLCSNLLGGSGTETAHQRPLCWSPIFSLARVHNKKFSTFFEYNSKWFLLGTSVIPFEKIPLRGTFAVQLSDHIDNYKLNSFDEAKWVFRLSLGF